MKAEKIIRVAALENNRPLSDDWKPKPVRLDENQSKVTLLDLFK